MDNLFTFMTGGHGDFFKIAVSVALIVAMLVGAVVSALKRSEAGVLFFAGVIVFSLILFLYFGFVEGWF